MVEVMGNRVSAFGLFRSKFLRKPLIIAIVLGLQQNWCGMNGILFFSTSLFEDAGISKRESRYATSGIGVIFFVSNMVSIGILPRFGRKTIFLMGTIGMAICCAVLAISMLYKEEVTALKYVNVCVSLMIIAFYALGPICVFWTMMSELFPHSARGAGIGVAFMCSFAGFFAHCYLFPYMLNMMHSYTFFVFTGIDVLMAVFVAVYIPETKNKSFAEIAATWTHTPHEIENQMENPSLYDSGLNTKEIVIQTVFKEMQETKAGTLYKVDLIEEQNLETKVST
ncbi:solute carrier family 2, facilitated glucose transporter member 3 [Aplysia californica]|uniref:Solute carrier family 2, facilitated glucose transporter member 3 n=1 Tax=Aplysia californica TaxID=6500 RepID=A0ABM1VZS3_APLCA|nr:solute carrier family 2, facilitated glucose transporter member 3 [Aplysia californica]